ncbi:MAG: hypothetical protein ACREA7_09235 [Nitrosotalea sp.]
MKKHTKKCNNCGEEIYFDPNQKSPSGKWIPIDAVTNKPHDCPNSSFRPYKTMGDEIVAQDRRDDEYLKRTKY